MILILAVFVLSLDQLTKSFIIQRLTCNQSIPVIPGIFHLTLVYNRGAAFGILKNQVPLFIFFSLIAISIIFIAIKDRNQDKFTLISLALILAGAIGNLIDRILLGYVIDFLDFRIWPVFNIADSAITIGAVLLGWNLLRSQVSSHKSQSHKCIL